MKRDKDEIIADIIEANKKLELAKQELVDLADELSRAVR